jgi:hypothetical protein
MSRRRRQRLDPPLDPIHKATRSQADLFSKRFATCVAEHSDRAASGATSDAAQLLGACRLWRAFRLEAQFAAVAGTG